MKTLSWYTDARRQQLDRGFAGLWFLFFTYAVLVWQGMIGDGTDYRPRQMVFLSGALLLQAIASMLRDRSRATIFSLYAASIVLLALALFAR